MSEFPYKHQKTRQYIENWLILGPFRTDQGLSDIETDYLFGETVELPSKGQPRLAERPWTAVKAPGGKYSFLNAGWPYTDYAVAYAHVYVHSPVDMDCRLVVGADDGVMVFLNGEHILTNDVNRAFNPEQDIVEAHLHPGWNRLMLKIRNGTADWAFSARFADSRLQTIETLDFRLDNPDPANRFGIPCRYADIRSRLECISAEAGRVCCRAVISNLGDYSAKDLCLLLDGQEQIHWEELHGGAVGTAELTVPEGRIRELIAGELATLRWQTASEHRMVGVSLGQPLGWLQRLVHSFADANLRRRALEFEQKASACITMPGYGQQMNERAMKILACVGNGDGSLELALEKGEALLREVNERLQGITVHLVAQSHIDMAWTWDWRETVDVVFPMTFGKALRMMDAYPEYKFTQNQMLGMAKCEEVYPEMFAQIQQRIREGRWVPIGGQWLEPDTNMPSGESLARHCLWGQRFAKSRFGKTHRTAWATDNFGHCWTLPQIFARSGIENYLFGRCGKGYPVFWWQGPDGSRVLAAHMRFPLPGGRLAEEALQTVTDYKVSHLMYLFGGGDHGGGPNEEDMAAIERLRQAEPSPRISLSGGQDFFDGIRPEAEGLPVVNEELNFQFEGCWTSQAEMKLRNRRLESLLYSAEALSAAARLPDLGWRPLGYEKAELDCAWEALLLNQFHDILPGSGIHDTHTEALQRYIDAEESAGRALSRAARRIASAAGTLGDGLPVVVVNSLPWERTGPVEVEVELPGGWKGIVAVDSDGRQAPAQLVGQASGGKARVLFTAWGVPALGFRTFWLRKEKSASDLKAHATSVLSSSLLEAAFDPASGALKSLTAGGREYLSGASNCLAALEDRPPSMSAWELGLTGRESPAVAGKVEILEQGPARITLRVKSSFGGSDFCQDISLYHGLDYLECRFEADWKERETLLVSKFSLACRPDSALYEIPFGYAERRGTGEERPALNWVAVEDPEQGIALLNNGRHGHAYQSGDLRLSVLRGTTDPDPVADIGHHAVKWALYPYTGTWKDACVARRGREFNTPMLALEAQPGRKGPFQMSLASLDASNVDLSCLKRREDSEELVVRLVEVTGSTANATLTLASPILEAAALDIPELEKMDKPCTVDGNRLMVSLKPFEIATFALRVGQPTRFD